MVFDGSSTQSKRPLLNAKPPFMSYHRAAINEINDWAKNKICYNIIQTLCKGIKTLHKNCLCSAFNGKANPLMMLPSISKSSPTPLKCSVS